MQCNKNTPHPSSCFCRFKPRELTLHSTASFLLVWTHLLSFVSQNLPTYFPGNVSFNNWNHITTKTTVCLCSKLLLLPISLPRNLQPLAPPALPLFPFSSLSFPLHGVTQKQFWKVFWTHQSVELKHMALVLPAYFVPKRERLCMTTRGGWRGSRWGQS